MAQVPSSVTPESGQVAVQPLVGELIVEDLFVEEPPTVRSSKKTARLEAEEGEIAPAPRKNEQAGAPKAGSGFTRFFAQKKDSREAPVLKAKEPLLSKPPRSSATKPPATASRRRAIVFFTACALMGFVLLEHGSLRGNHAIVAPPSFLPKGVKTAATEAPFFPTPTRSIVHPVKAPPAPHPILAQTAPSPHPLATGAQVVAPVAPPVPPPTPSFAPLPTLNVQAGIAEAQAVWVTGSLVEISLSPGAATLTVRLPLVQSNETLSYEAPLSPEQAQDLLELTTPAGCTRAPPAFSQDGSELDQVFRCEVPAATLSAEDTRALEGQHPPSLETATVSTIGALSAAVENRYIVMTAPLPQANGVALGEANASPPPAQRISGTSLSGQPLEVRGRFSDLSGFESFLSLLQAAPVSLTHLSISANRFDLQLQILGTPST